MRVLATSAFLSVLVAILAAPARRIRLNNHEGTNLLSMTKLQGSRSKLNWEHVKPKSTGARQFKTSSWVQSFTLRNKVPYLPASKPQVPRDAFADKKSSKARAVIHMRNPRSTVGTSKASRVSLQVSFRQQGLSGSMCTTSDQCVGERLCQEGTMGGTRCAFPNRGFLRCNANSDCDAGELCLENTSTNVSLCLSEDFAREVGAINSSPTQPPAQPPTDEEETPANDEESPTNPGESESEDTGTSQEANELPSGGESSEVNDNPCIGIDSLQQFRREELVFEKDVLSNVLCDEKNSCATAGHMVTYRGKGMMMKSYCEVVGSCTKRVMLVNSPRYRMKLAVPSKSDHLVFTSFSARYATRAEEHVLSTAIRMGF